MIYIDFPHTLKQKVRKKIPFNTRKSDNSQLEKPKRERFYYTFWSLNTSFMEMVDLTITIYSAKITPLSC